MMVSTRALLARLSLAGQGGMGQPAAMMRLIAPVVLVAAVLAGCQSACPICYEDEWSREPFPGQPKQHIPTPEVRNGQAVTE